MEETKAMDEIKSRTILGVLGGLGPVASVEFLKTIYEYGLRGEREQDSPTVILYSDPTFPDRTDAFLDGRSAPLLKQLTCALERLLDAGATKIVLCCMTIHYLLPELPPHLREKIVSLLDVIFAHLNRHPKKRLLICSTGTLRLKLFQRHPLWPRAEPFVVLPGEADQHTIHRDLIYPIKKNPKLDTLFPLLESLLEKYEVDSFIAGCSEVHLLAKQFVSSGGARANYSCVDPLATVARELALENLRNSPPMPPDHTREAVITTR